MKKFVYILFVIATCLACSDDNGGFSISLPGNAFSFKPIAGGAVMHYNLPNDSSIIGIKIRYKDFKGDDILRSGSSLCDTLDIVGFNEARHSVPAYVTLCKTNGEESQPIAVAFDTDDSGPVAFFDKVQVKSGWNGFSVMVDNPSHTSGLAHVFYLGKDPRTQQPDTILIKTFNLEAGKDTLVFQLQQQKEDNTVIIRTEDFRGYMVKEKAWDKIISYNTVKYDPSSFVYSCDKSVENGAEMYGIKYLFDGDIKGTSFYEDRDDTHYRTFLSGPYGTEAPIYIDLGEAKMVAQVRLYAPLEISGMTYLKGSYSNIWLGLYVDKLPCSATLYGSNDSSSTGDLPNKNWTKISSFQQDPNLDGAMRWCTGCAGDYYRCKTYRSKAEIDAADSIFVPLDIPLTETTGKYRYLKLVVNSVFNNNGPYWWEDNSYKYVAIKELEVYGKKED